MPTGVRRFSTVGKTVRTIAALGLLAVAWAAFDIFLQTSDGRLSAPVSSVVTRLDAAWPELVEVLPHGPPEPPPDQRTHIVVDPGHGGEDGGTKGFGVIEKNPALQVGLLLASELEKRGHRVSLTRRADETLPLSRRAEMANEWKADLFVSVHFNHADVASVRGIETFFSSPKSFECRRLLLERLGPNADPGLYDEPSRRLAEAVHRGAIKAADLADHEVKNRPELAVTRHTACPAVLVECGFLSNKAEASNAVDPNWQQRIAKGIADGIEEFLHTSHTVLTTPAAAN